MYVLYYTQSINYVYNKRCVEINYSEGENIMAAARVSSDPKEIRFEIRLTGGEEKMLNYCAESYSLTKAGVIISGIKMMYEKADAEKERQERQYSIDEAMKERGEKVRKEAYDEAYEKAYSEKFSELILDPDYLPSEAREDAKYYAEDIAKEEADEVVKDFWKS